MRYDTYEDNETVDETLRLKKVNDDVAVSSTDWAKAQIDRGCC